MKKMIYCLLILIFIACVVYAVFKNTKNVEVETDVNEYTPQEEISNAQNRMTLLTLYFVDSASGKLIPEVRQIDVKEIIDNPYEKIMNLLIAGSQNESIGKSVPEGTKLNGIKLEKENLVIDVSKEFTTKYEAGSEEQKNMIFSVVNTFLEFKEVSSVTFLIDGEACEELKEPFTKLRES